MKGVALPGGVPTAGRTGVLESVAGGQQLERVDGKRILDQEKGEPM
jgi:hypothetical protein